MIALTELYFFCEVVLPFKKQHNGATSKQKGDDIL